MSATGRTEAAGFTLIEMLVVLAILGLISAIAFPAVERAVDGRRFSHAVAEVEDRLYAARANAIATARPAAFTPEQDRDGIAVAVTGQAPVFYPDGSASAGTVTVSAGKRAARFRVDPGTGEIARLP